MKKIAMMSTCVLALITLSGCASYHTTTKQARLRPNEMMPFSITQPIALHNVAPQKGEVKIGSGIGWKVFGDTHQYTESCIATLKSEFQKRGMPVSGNAAKSLEIEISSAKAKSGAFTFAASAHLKIKTGSGLAREYEGRQNYFNVPETTEAIENSIAHCIEQMLNDKDVVAYLNN